MRKTCVQSLLLALLLAVVPAAAHAWTLTVKVTGGSLAQANTVVLAGGVSKTIAGGNATVYPTASTTVSVNTAQGYTSIVTLDGMVSSNSFSLSSGSHTVTVAYSGPPVSSLAIAPGTGGAAYVLLPNNTWSGGGTSDVKIGTTLRYSITADRGHVVKSYTINGIRTDVNGSTVGQSVTGSFDTVAGSNTIAAEFGLFVMINGSLSAPTGGATTQPVNCTVTASSNDTGLSYSFNVTGPQAFSSDWSTTQTFSFTPVLPGTYQVSARVKSDNGGSFIAPAATVVVSDYQAQLNSGCTSCHSTQSPTIVASYQASLLHTANPASTCASCHSADAPHSNGINSTNVDAATFQVKSSAADGMALGSSFCIKCHDTTIDPLFAASQHKSSGLSCASCHTNGVHNVDFTSVPVRPFAAENYTNRDVAESNICMNCHSGSNTGNSIATQAGLADFSNLPFVAPGAGVAGGTLHGMAGYRFPGRSYALYSSNSHRAIGMYNNNGTGTGGPCVGCHMSSDAKHSFQAAATDASGAVTAIESSACAQCHAGSLDATQLAADQAAFAGGLKVLQAMLADRGFAYSPAPPYFSSTNWGTGQAGANAMGAAYNYQMLVAEPGAYAHNGAYARQLIADSIDFLYNGSVTGSTDTALAYLVQKGGITQGDADGMTAYKAANACSSCHTNTTGSHTKHLSDSIGCASCHSLTAASNSTLVNGTQKHLNGVNDVNLAAGGSYVAGTCSTVYCHSNGDGTYASPVWGVGSSNCFYCHPASSLRGAHAAHIGALVPTAYGDTANYSTADEYRFGCANCHPTAASSHRDGHVDVTLVPTADGSLRSRNNPSVLIGGIGNSGSGITGNPGSSVVCSAAYCHSNGGVGGALQYVPSPDWYNAQAYTGDKCAMCHGNGPTSGAHAKHAVSIHTGQIVGPDGLLTLGHGDSIPATIINCDLCHSATVTNSNNDQGTACASCHAGDPKGTPTLDKTRHLNGSVDVVFQAVNLVTKAQVRSSSFHAYSTVWTRTGGYKAGAGSFDTSKLMLSQGGWDGTGKNCSNVACHNGGTPNWNGSLSCVDCHSSL